MDDEKRRVAAPGPFYSDSAALPQLVQAPQLVREGPFQDAAPPLPEQAPPPQMPPLPEALDRHALHFPEGRVSTGGPHGPGSHAYETDNGQVEPGTMSELIAEMYRLGGM